MTVAISEQPGFQRPLVLIVDDERLVLNALERALRKLPCDLVTAQGGAEALAMCERINPDIVLSDMRMPEMDGAALLTEIGERCPQSVRIILSGYSDHENTVRAINDGHIDNFVPKPWDDDELRDLVEEKIDFVLVDRLKRERSARARSDNASLKQKARAYELELAKKHSNLEYQTRQIRQSYLALQESYGSAVRLMANLVDQRIGHDKNNSSRVVQDYTSLAEKLGLEAHQVEHGVIAARLRNIGKISFPDVLLQQPVRSLSGAMLGEYLLHPYYAATLLSYSKHLEVAGRIILCHQESIDAGGFPRRLAGDAIPLESRLLKVVGDFHDFCSGVISGEPLSPEQAMAQLEAGSGSKYDRLVLEFFTEVKQEHLLGDDARDLLYASDQLLPGMELATDLVTERGILVLAAGVVLDAGSISQVSELEDTFEEKLLICVKSPAV